MVQTVSNSNSEASQLLSSFWPKATEDIKNMIPNDFKHQELPLARIKKIMKLDEDVKMISAEAPVLFSKAAELFITELTLRAWVHTEDNKRRTLQRNDIAMAISKFDQFDFLIDIVPRDELKPSKPRDEGVSRNGATAITDQVQYYLQLAQQNQQALQQTTQQQPSVASATPQQIQIVQPGGQIQTINVVPAAQVVQASQAAVSGAAGQQVVVQGLNLGAVQQQQQQQAQQQQQQQQAQNQQQLASGIQVVQQVVGPNGEVQQIPLQLTPQQLQLIRMQLGANGGQSLMLQAATGQQGSQQQLE